ncbi:MAG TPA: glycosyltransferase family 4 protein [Solirubrobacterales bacterium]|nr:glycosyltransferase family 4 protein [Solirubrobacterales bacterium]
MTSGPRGRRVVLACDYFLRYTAMLAGGLARSGAEVRLLSRSHDGEFGGESGAARRFVAEATGRRAAHSALSGRVRSAAGWRGAARLRSQARAFAPEVVHLQESILNDPRLFIAARARPGRFALTVHDPARHPGDRSSWRIALSNRALVRAAGLIFVHGEALRDELVESVGPRAPVVVVPHGVDAGSAEPLPQRPALLFFGRHSYYKGLDVLLDAMDAIWQAVPEATLTVAGEGPVEEHPALADPRVEVRAGHVPEADVPALIAAARCVVLPYRQASQSGVGSLAKAHERPLVASAVGALPELLADGSGLLVPPEDPAALAEALTSVLSQRDLAERLARAGAESAARESSWDAVAAKTLEAYERYLLP